MALEVEQLIKIILGVLVVVAVIAGVYLVLGGKVLDFFKGLSPGNPEQIFIALIK